MKMLYNAFREEQYNRDDWENSNRWINHSGIIITDGHTGKSYEKSHYQKAKIQSRNKSIASKISSQKLLHRSRSTFLHTLSITVLLLLFTCLTHGDKTYREGKDRTFRGEGMSGDWHDHHHPVLDQEGANEYLKEKKMGRSYFILLKKFFLKN